MPNDLAVKAKLGLEMRVIVEKKQNIVGGRQSQWRRWKTRHDKNGEEGGENRVSKRERPKMMTFFKLKRKVKT